MTGAQKCKNSLKMSLTLVFLQVFIKAWFSLTFIKIYTISIDRYDFNFNFNFSEKIVKLFYCTEQI